MLVAWSWPCSLCVYRFTPRCTRQQTTRSCSISSVVSWELSPHLLPSLIIIKVFLKRKISSLETILSARAREHTHPHTLTGSHAHNANKKHTHTGTHTHTHTELRKTWGVGGGGVKTNLKAKRERERLEPFVTKPYASWAKIKQDFCQKSQKRKRSKQH